MGQGVAPWLFLECQQLPPPAGRDVTNCVFSPPLSLHGGVNFLSESMPDRDVGCVVCQLSEPEQVAVSEYPSRGAQPGQGTTSGGCVDTASQE